MGGDCRGASLLKHLAENPFWMLLFATFRAVEASSRMCILVALLVVFQPIFTNAALVIICFDLLVSASLMYGMGREKKPFAIIQFSAIYLSSNVDLFQDNYVARRWADTIDRVRFVEYFLFALGTAYYFRFVKGGKAMIMGHLGLVLLSCSFLLYFLS